MTTKNSESDELTRVVQCLVANDYVKTAALRLPNYGIVLDGNRNEMVCKIQSLVKSGNLSQDDVAALFIGLHNVMGMKDIAVRDLIGKLYLDQIKASGAHPEFLVAYPCFCSLWIAMQVAQSMKLPLLTKGTIKDSARDFGGRIIGGNESANGKEGALIKCVQTTGNSVTQYCEILKENGIHVKNVYSFLDRGASEQHAALKRHSILSMELLKEILGRNKQYKDLVD